MKWTISSLYLMVFVSLLGFGWAMDRVYENYQNQGNDPLETHKSIFASFKDQIDNNPQYFNLSIQKQPEFLPNLFQLDKSENFPLPDKLLSQLNAGEMIILDSEQGISLHQRLSNYPYILGFGPIADGLSQPQHLEFTLTVVFYLGIALVLIVWITPLVRSVQKLSEAVKAVGDGKLDSRLDQKSLYLSDLNKDFNDMAERLNTLSDNNQLFSQAVSHDLRTPLSRIKFALEKLEQKDDSDQDHEVIDKIHQDIAQIENLTSELLDYARIGQTRVLQVDDVDIDVFLQQVIAEFSEQHKSIEYVPVSNQNWQYQLDSKLFYKVVNNLLENALYFATGKVRVRLGSINTSYEITIEDDGPGIDAEILDSIFMPFLQGGKKTRKHFGLGLAICERATKLLGGSISADNHSSLGGARFIVRLPV